MPPSGCNPPSSSSLHALRACWLPAGIPKSRNNSIVYVVDVHFGEHNPPSPDLPAAHPPRESCFSSNCAPTLPRNLRPLPLDRVAARLNQVPQHLPPKRRIPLQQPLHHSLVASLGFTSASQMRARSII